MVSLTLRLHILHSAETSSNINKFFFRKSELWISIWDNLPNAHKNKEKNTVRKQINSVILETFQGDEL